jgi:TP901 family phage tail tape measure protein
MARMYEMNLIIRLQDRASARMRRISGDMSALSRHAQAQNKLMQLQAQSQRVQLSQGQALANIRSLEHKDGQKRLANLSAQSKLTAQLARQETAMNKTRRVRGEVIQRAIPYQSREKFIRLETEAERQQWIKKKSYNKAEQAMLYDYLTLRTNQLGMENKISGELATQNRILGGTISEQRLLNAEIEKRISLEAASNAAANKYKQGRAIAHGGSLAFMGGAVAVGLSGLAASSYAKFDVSATKAATQIGDVNLKILPAIAQTKVATKELEQRLLGLAKIYPATADEMAQASYNVFSSMDLGATATERMKNGVNVLTEANKAAVGGQVDLATATDTLITVFNDFDPNLKNMHSNMAQLFAIVRFMRGGFTELGAGMNKLAPAAKQAKQSLIEVGAAFSIITQAIPSAAQASTAEARLLDLFGRKEFIAGMKRAGEDITDANGQLLKFSDIMKHIVALDPSLMLGGPKLTQFVKEITQFGSATGKGGFRGTIQMQRALSVLITEHYKHLRILKQATADTVEYDKSVKALSDTAGVKWKIAMNQLKVAWIQFGQSVMPILLRVLGFFTTLLDKFNGLGGGTKKFVSELIVIAGILATFGGLFASAFGGVAMVLATVRLRKVEGALRAIAAANVEVEATSVGAKAGILGIGKTALKTAGWLTVLYLAYQNVRNAANMKDVDGNVFQKGARWWVSQFKSASQDFSGMFGVDTASMYDSLFKQFPGIFGKANKATKKHLTEIQKIAAEAEAAAIKSGNSKLDRIIKINAAAAESDKKLSDYEKRLAKATTEAKQQALKQQKSDIDSAAKNLLSKYKELDAVNKAATGSLLGGPISGGPILSAFSQINQTLMGVGVKPIKVPVEFLMQDAQNQLSNFNLWRGGLKTLSKKLPKEMLTELQAAGIEKLPEILSLAGAGPAFLSAYVKVWKDTKSARESATQADFQSQLALWNSFGKDVAWQIVNGLVDSGAEAKLYEGFTSLITTTFAGQLTSSMNQAVAEAVASWKESNPVPSTTKPATAKETAWATTKIYAEQRASLEADYKATQDANKWYQYSNPNLKAKPVANSMAGKNYPISRAIPHISFRASGGIIPGRGSGDTVPAMLTPGEVVLNKRHVANASRMLGTANNPHSVFNKVQHFADGGVAAAQNYKNMKNVNIVRSRDGSIRVVNNKGVTYRTFRPGQPGYDEFGDKKRGSFLGNVTKKALHYGTGDLLRDADAVMYGLTGSHAREAAKGYLSAAGVPKIHLSAKDKKEFNALSEFYAMGIGTAGLGAGSMRVSGLTRTGATKTTASLAKGRVKSYLNTGSLGEHAFGITPKKVIPSLRDRIKAAEGVGSVDTSKLSTTQAKTTSLTSAQKSQLRKKSSPEIFTDPGAATTREEIAARRAQLERKKVELGIKSKFAQEYDYIGIKLLTPEELEALEERMRKTDLYTGPANQRPDVTKSRASRDNAARKLLAKRQANAASNNEQSLAKYSSMRDASVQAGISNTRDLLERFDKFSGDWDTLYYSGYPESAADVAGSFLYHIKATNKRLAEDLKSARTNQTRIKRIKESTPPTGPMPTGTKKPAKAIPGTRGALANMRAAKAKKAAMNKPRPKTGTTEEAIIRRGIHSAQDALMSRGMGREAHEAYLKYKDNPHQLLTTYEYMLKSVGVGPNRIKSILGRLAKDETGTLNIGEMFPKGLKGKEFPKSWNTVSGKYIESSWKKNKGEMEQLLSVLYSSKSSMEAFKAYRPNHPTPHLEALGHSRIQFAPMKTHVSYVQSRTGKLDDFLGLLAPAINRWRTEGIPISADVVNPKLAKMIIKFSKREPGMFDAGTLAMTKTMIPNIDELFGPSSEVSPFRRLWEGYAKGGWVKGSGNNDSIPAFLTPGEYVVSKPMIKSLTKQNANSTPANNVTHETNINVDVTNPTGRAILDALKPVLFSLRHQP